jgi:hypothetical protein
MEFNATQKERKIIGKIARRAASLNPAYNHTDAMMDVEAAHCNGCRLKLKELLAAKDSDFGHDVFGINRHLNRKTGNLEDHFLPRYAEKQ